MAMYIKVGKNKKGEKIISDIKFETFGCAAAISTSSMITELAKGKTLDEAMKITRADVSEGLGGLPPIKEHCSNLAADALAEAIYDYIIRQKMPVPDALQAAHERIRSKEHEHA
jgi:nitrogen fixation NifU-like protein